MRRAGGSYLKGWGLGFCVFFLPFWGLGQAMEHDVLRLSEADSLYKTGRYDFHPYFYVFFDSLPNRPIEEVSDPDFQQHFFKDSSYLSKSYLGDRNRGINGLWGRLTLYADYERDQEWLISFNAGFFDLYTPDGSGHYESRRSGFGIPINDQEFGDSYGFLPCLSLYLPAQDTLTLFVKLKAVGISLFHPTHKTFDQTVFKPHAYAAKDRQVRFFDALVIGILLGVAIYHLIIFLYQRKRVSLFFSLFVVNMLFLMFLSHTYLQEFFFQETTIRRVSLMVAINWFFWYLFHYLFSRDFLQLPQYLRWGDRIWLGLILFDLLTILIALGKMFLPEDWALVSALRAIPLVMIRVWEQTLLNWVSIALALVLALKGHKAARIYLVAMLAAVLQEFVNSPNAFFGLFPLPEWIHGYAGRIITVLLFAMGIARQLKTLEEEKLAAKQAEAQEKSENQRMRELDDFKTRFYTHITHQFRTPLTIILGMAEQIRQHPTNWLNQGTKMIEHNGRRLLLLVNQILNLSKLEAGSLPVKRVQGNVVPYIRYLVESFHSFAQQKNLHLKFETPLESLVMDYDPEKLMDVLSNLIANAIKFTPVGGTVKVLVDIHENKQLQIQVADTGPGIRETDLPRIFDRFYQSAHQSTADQGSGIGLALSKELVELMDGKISVASELGQGAVFTVCLPITQSAEMAEELSPHVVQEKVSPYLIGPEKEAKPEEETARQERSTVLIVEDNPDVITYLRSVLHPRFQLAVAQNGQDGLAQARKSIPDLIVSDIMMPKMDGREMCQKLKQDSLTSHIPIILLTAKADAESKLEGLGVGADAYLTKPFHQEELLVRIEQLIRLRARLQERYRDLRFLFQPESTLGERETHPEDHFLREVQEIVESKLSHPDFSIAQLCQCMGLSRAQLYRKFKALTNQSVGEFIRKVRLHKARELLQSTRLNVTQVAMEVGFKSLPSFSRSYGEEFGEKPSEARKATS